MQEMSALAETLESSATKIDADEPQPPYPESLATKIDDDQTQPPLPKVSLCDDKKSIWTKVHMPRLGATMFIEENGDTIAADTYEYMKDMHHDEEDGVVNCPAQKVSSTVANEMTAPPEMSCAECRTTKTPMWRSGPAGKGSLCNACGLRHRKMQKAAGGIEAVIRKRKPKLDLAEVLRQPLLMALSQLAEVFEESEKKKKKTGEEEEQAALLLISLSEKSPSSSST